MTTTTGKGWIMASKKGEQFVLFDVDEPEAAPTAPTTTESLQPSLFDVGDDEAPEPTQTDTEPDTRTEESTTPDGNAEGVEPTGTEQLDENTPTSPSLPPAGESADGHAVIVTAAGTYTPSGQTLTGPVDSVEKLDKLIRWAALTPLGAPAQIWVVGIDACEMLGWVIDPGS